MKNENLADAIKFFEEEHDLILETVKVKCKSCNNSWGIKLADYDSIEHIPFRKFVCENCYGNVKK